VAPPKDCDPAVRLIRFEALHGNLIEQHKLAGLTTALLQWSRTTRPQKPLSELPSLHCSSTTIAGAS
jgi:hypothetical protein